MPGFTPDEIQRYNIPDLYPRRDDPFRPRPYPIPGSVPAGAQGAYDGTLEDQLSLTLTEPGPRPVVYQQALNFNVTLAANVAQALTTGSFQCDTIVLDVFSTAANSAFFGYGAQINATNGIEIRPGLPIAITPENFREPWELQRMLEAIFAVMAGKELADSLGAYRAPRVVFDSSKYFLFATAATAVSVMLFTVPELQ
jgi:hypothetical protein